jgi:hypothetical protein
MSKRILLKNPATLVTVEKAFFFQRIFHYQGSSGSKTSQSYSDCSKRNPLSDNEISKCWIFHTNQAESFISNKNVQERNKKIRKKDEEEDKSGGRTMAIYLPNRPPHPPFKLKIGLNENLST